MIDPAAMPLTRLANSIIDGVAPAPAPVAAEIEKYLGTDLLFYRADEPDGLVARQAQHWDPVLEWARETLGARFVLAEGVMHVRAAGRGDRGGGGGDPDGATSRGLAARRAQRRHHADRLGAARAGARGAAGSPSTRPGPRRMSTRTGTWQLWGRDELALERRAYRFAEMQAAAPVLSHA